MIGVKKSFVWPSSSEIAVIFIGHVFKNSAVYIICIFFFQSLTYCSVRFVYRSQICVGLVLNKLVRNSPLFV